MNILSRFRPKPQPAPLVPVAADWNKPFETLRKKWVQVPADPQGRSQTETLLALPDADLLEYWTSVRRDLTTGEQFQHRGWYHALYAPQMAGKKVMDVGSGMAVDSITFAQHGARMTFVDLAEQNLAVVKRVCGLLGVTNATFVHLTDLDALKPLDLDYDIIMAMGSLHHAPTTLIKPECAELLRHLKVGGRWLQLAYPRARWEREGQHPPEVWGQCTDGSNTPWADWLDVSRVMDILSPATFDLVLYYEFHNQDFNWFDLLYRG